jgi:hypothetical protein
LVVDSPPSGCTGVGWVFGVFKILVVDSLIIVIKNMYTKEYDKKIESFNCPQTSGPQNENA